MKIFNLEHHIVMTSTDSAWIASKLENLTKFLEKILPTENPLRQELAKLAQIPHSLLFVIIRSELLPFEHKLEAFLSERVSKHEIKLIPEDFAKLLEYLKLLCDLAKLEK